MSDTHDLVLKGGSSPVRFHEVLERGRYDPSLTLAFKLADVFAETIETLFKPD